MNQKFESFALTIAELNRLVQKMKEREMNELGLKASHTMCLYYLGCHEEGLTAAEMTKYCKEDKAAISRALAALEERELVIRNIPEEKRAYRTLYFLTEEGKYMVSQVNERIDYILEVAGEGLSEEQRDNFYSFAERILHNLNQYEKTEEKAVLKSKMKNK